MATRSWTVNGCGSAARAGSRRRQHGETEEQLAHEKTSERKGRVEGDRRSTPTPFSSLEICCRGDLRSPFAGQDTGNRPYAYPHPPNRSISAIRSWMCLRRRRPAARGPRSGGAGCRRRGSPCARKAAAPARDGARGGSTSSSIASRKESSAAARSRLCSSGLLLGGGLGEPQPPLEEMGLGVLGHPMPAPSPARPRRASAAPARVEPGVLAHHRLQVAGEGLVQRSARSAATGMPAYGPGCCGEVLPGGLHPLAAGAGGCRRRTPRPAWGSPWSSRSAR